MPSAPQTSHPFAPHAVRLAALWVLAGCASKAVSGMPTDLPYFFANLEIDPTSVIVAGTLLVLYAVGMKGLAEVVLEMITWSWVMFLAKLGFVVVSLYVAALAAGQANRSETRG